MCYPVYFVEFTEWKLLYDYGEIRKYILCSLFVKNQHEILHLISYFARNLSTIFFRYVQNVMFSSQ